MTGINKLTEQTAELIARARKIVFFTGAGISTESGIPDFRSPGGVWSEYDPDDFTIDKFLSSAETRKLHWKFFREGGLIGNTEPNRAHYAIAEIDKLGKLDSIITQNVDNLHQRAGSSPEKVLELHGNMRFVRCLGCNKRYPSEDVLIRSATEGVPDCEICHGILKPDAIFFGEPLPQQTLNDATDHARNCDLFIVIGSTLAVYPAAYLPMYASRAGVPIIIINLSPTPLDSHASIVINGRAGDVMDTIISTVRKKLSNQQSKGH